MWKNKEFISTVIALIGFLILLGIIIFFVVRSNRTNPAEQYEMESAEDASEIYEMQRSEKETEIKPLKGITAVYEEEKALQYKYYNQKDVYLIAQALMGGTINVPSMTNKAAVVWCMLNRVDAGYGSIAEVVTHKGWFDWNENLVPTCEAYEIALDVLGRWSLEKQGQVNVGRVLPKDYLWYHGNLVDKQYFRNDYEDFSKLWDFSLESPYET